VAAGEAAAGLLAFVLQYAASVLAAALSKEAAALHLTLRVTQVVLRAGGSSRTGSCPMTVGSLARQHQQGLLSSGLLPAKSMATMLVAAAYLAAAAAAAVTFDAAVALMLHRSCSEKISLPADRQGCVLHWL